MVIVRFAAPSARAEYERRALAAIHADLDARRAHEAREIEQGKRLMALEAERLAD